MCAPLNEGLKILNVWLVPALIFIDFLKIDFQNIKNYVLADNAHELMLQVSMVRVFISFFNDIFIAGTIGGCPKTST